MHGWHALDAGSSTHAVAGAATTTFRILAMLAARVTGVRAGWALVAAGRPGVE